MVKQNQPELPPQPTMRPRGGERAGPIVRLFLRDDALLEGLLAAQDGQKKLMAHSLSARRNAGLAAGEFEALLALIENGQPIGQLAERLGVDAPTLTRTVQKLEARALLHRQKDKNDRRRILLHLTEKGRGLVMAVSVEMRRTLAEAYRQAGDDAVAGFERVLADLRRAKNR